MAVLYLNQVISMCMLCALISMAKGQNLSKGEMCKQGCVNKLVRWHLDKKGLKTFQVKWINSKNRNFTRTGKTVHHIKTRLLAVLF
jgi:hypothetical protein